MAIGNAPAIGHQVVQLTAEGSFLCLMRKGEKDYAFWRGRMKGPWVSYIWLTSGFCSTLCVMSKIS